MAPYNAPYGRRCHIPSCWTELSEQRVLGPELVSDIKDKVRLIRDRLKATSDRQKSYADLKHREIERYRSDPMHIVPMEEIEVRLHLTIEEEPVQILDRDVKVLKRKSIPLVKVLWHNHSTEGATLEPKDAICQQCPHLF
ncbi:uncharacterized protein [Gossypium hirsutum]|uniref:Reverse transcriptase domain-containing protein n=1 Tax=Gossypium hirsutum TaxID=3635 RepID=A0ABM3AM66_GOSHI|nr:uncharacterized protein LOC107907229 [Gossypium hirsutum]